MRLARYLVLVVVLVLLGLATVWQRLELLRLGYEVHELDRRAERLRDESRVLESRVVELSGPEKALRKAEELGLEPVALAPGRRE